MNGCTPAHGLWSEAAGATAASTRVIYESLLIL